MTRPSISRLFLTAAVIAGQAWLPVTAGANDYAQGAREYAARHYSVALQYFGNAVRSNPKDFNSYYYMGLCYQALRQMTQARQNFDYVARSSPNPGLRANAALASSQLSKYAGGTAGGAQPASSPVAVAAAPAGAGGDRIHGKLQVVEFYTDW